MKKTLTTILFLLTLFTSSAQATYEPQILILSVNDVKYDKVFAKEISSLNELVKRNNKSAEQEKTYGQKILQHSLKTSEG